MRDEHFEGMKLKTLLKNKHSYWALNHDLNQFVEQRTFDKWQVNCVCWQFRTAVKVCVLAVIMVITSDSEIKFLLPFTARQ